MVPNMMEWSSTESDEGKSQRTDLDDAELKRLNEDSDTGSRPEIMFVAREVLTAASEL
jgi:hypothetical protein